MNKPTQIKKVFSFLYYLLFFSLALGQLTRFQINSHTAIYLHDIIISLIITFWCLLQLISPKKTFSLPYSKPIFFLISALVFSSLFNYSNFRYLPSVLYLVRWLVYFSVFPITYNLLKTKQLKLNTSSYLLQITLAYASIGLLQYVFIPDTRVLYQFGWDDHLNRLISTLFDPGFTGLLLIFGLIISLNKPKFVPVFLTSLALTYSRASFLTAFVVFIIYGLKYSFKKSLIYIVILLALIILLPRTAGDGVKLERSYSITSRADTTLNALQVFKHSPLIGVGFNNYYPAAQKTPNQNLPDHANSPDNSFVFILATTGILGLFTFLNWYLRLFKFAYNHSQLLFLTLTAITIHSFTNNSLFYPFASIWLWILLAQEFSASQTST